MFPVPALTLGRFAFGVRFALADLLALLLLFALAFAFSFSFLFLGRFGRFSLELAFAEEFEFRFSDSGGCTVSEASPAFAARLMSIATV